MENKYCPICNEEILIQYVVPIKTYRIENEKFIREDAWTGDGYDNPSLEFICSNDISHELDNDDILDWMYKIEQKFLSEVLKHE